MVDSRPASDGDDGQGSPVHGTLCLLLTRFTSGIRTLAAIDGAGLVRALTTALQVFVIHVHGLIDLGAQRIVIRGPVPKSVEFILTKISAKLTER